MASLDRRESRGDHRCKKRDWAGAASRSRRLGLGCMGLSYGYGPAADQAAGDRADPRRRRARRHLLRHRRDLRPVHQRGAGRRGAGAGPRPGRDRDQVRLRARRQTASRAASNSRPEHIRAGRRRLAEAAADRRHRPLLPAPRRPERADRGRGRHRQGPDRRRARSSTSACPRPARRPSAARTRCSRWTALQSEYSLWWREPEEEVLPTLRGARHRLRAVQPARQGLPDRADRRDTRPSTSTTSAASCRASRPRRARPTRRWSTCSARSPAAQARDAGAGRARLAAGAEAVDRADPRHHQAGHGSAPGPQRLELRSSDGAGPRDRRQRHRRRRSPVQGRRRGGGRLHRRHASATCHKGEEQCREGSTPPITATSITDIRPMAAIPTHR